MPPFGQPWVVFLVVPLRRSQLAESRGPGRMQAARDYAHCIPTCPPPPNPPWEDGPMLDAARPARWVGERCGRRPVNSIAHLLVGS